MKQLLIPCIAGILAGKMVVDLFAGFGGASRGIEVAIGRSPDVTCNHDQHKIKVHALNHPATVHLCDDVRKLKPKEVTKGWKVGLLWGSPDCRHFSRAKGSAPVSDSVRSLAWELVTWADEVRPEVIALENVPEFMTWGDLDEHGVPIPEKAGETFKAFVQALRDLGYIVDWRVLCAADYGVPTTRKRLFLIAWLRADPIPWPEPTHAHRSKAKALGLLPWRTAGECIDFSKPVPSIRDRKRPLAEATCRRVAKGALRFVINAAEPYIIRTGQTGGGGGYSQSIHDPLSTIVTKAEHCVVAPVIAQIGQRHGGGQKSAGDPLSTITGTERDAVVAVNLAALRGGEGSHRHGDDAHEPLRTVSAKGTHHAVIAASLVRNYTGMDGGDLRLPLPTVTAKDHHSLLAASLVQTGYGERQGQAPRAMSLDDPLGTVVSGGAKHALSTAFLTQYYSSGGQDQDVADPMHAVTTRARHAMVVASLGNNLAGAIWAARFLMKYADDVPVTWLSIGGRLRPVVIVHIDGADYLLTDLGLRMLEPRELARAQGFPDDYILEGTKAQQIAGIGNSVCPPLAAAIIRKLFPGERIEFPKPRRRKAAA